MTKPTPHPKVDAFLKKAKAWREEMTALREITLGAGLTEELKWGKPCYTFQGRNVAIIIPFKESCALMFSQGALLKDAKRILLKPGENTQAGRWAKFKTGDEIEALASTLKAYLEEAIAAEKAGRKVEFKQSRQLELPEEFLSRLNAEPELKRAFAALTPGRQRAYSLFFTGAKQSQTRAARVEKCVPRILSGRGLNED